MAEVASWMSNRPLRVGLLALVLLNLVFVQISSGVAPHWMVPMFGLTLFSPWLVRMQPSLVYRAVWNVGVLAIFTLLVFDGLRTGVRYLLEDGLILAAFCQVHLLNNLGPRQKPDLLFFNSFLIALVTSFFCQDIAFALVFGLYAFALVWSLQLATAGRTSGWVGDGVRKAAAVLAVTFLVFAVCPRDFTREGLVEETLRESGMVQVGFTEQVELGRSAKTVVSNRVVMRVRMLEGHAGAVPLHWRGASFVWYDGRRWHPDDRPQDAREGSQRTWMQPRAGRLVRGARETSARVSVELHEREHRRLFVPLTTHQVDLDRESGLFFMPQADGSLKFVSSRDTGEPATLRYTLRVFEPDPPSAETDRSDDVRRRMPHLLATHGLPESGAELARALAVRHRGEPQHRLVEAMASHLSQNLSYLLPGAQGAARTLEDFLAGEGGHCEYFATALALMLRSVGVPCRLVTGYASGEWDESRTELTVRSRHGHAWVEVLDPSGTWYTVDPSPSADAAAAEETSWWTVMRTSLSDWWDEVATFDADARTATLAWFGELPGRGARWLGRNPWTALGALALVVAAVSWWVRRRVRAPRAVQDYLGAVRRAGLEPRVGETPRELLERARGAQVKAPALECLVRATEAHEQARYS